MSRLFCSMRKSARDYLPAGSSVHESDADSREGLIVPELIARYVANTMGCSVCIKKCVFHAGDYATIKAGYERRQG